MRTKLTPAFCQKATVQQGAESVLWGTRLGAEGPAGGVFEDGEPLE